MPIDIAMLLCDHVSRLRIAEWFRMREAGDVHGRIGQLMCVRHSRIPIRIGDLRCGLSCLRQRVSDELITFVLPGVEILRMAHVFTTRIIRIDCPVIGAVVALRG